MAYPSPRPVRATEIKISRARNYSVIPGKKGMSTSRYSVTQNEQEICSIPLYVLVVLTAPDHV